MTISNVNPIAGSLLTPADAVSFTLTPNGAITFLQVSYQGTATEVVLFATTFQPGFEGEQVFPPGGGDDRDITFSRTAGWDASPFTIRVDWVDDSGGQVATWSYELANQSLYPELMQPRNPVSQGTLQVTEGSVDKGTDIGWIEFNEDDFDLDKLGNGKVAVNANASLKGGGPGGGPALGGIGRWVIQNVAGSGTPTAGKIVINSDDNTAITQIIMDTSTADGQDYEEWLQTFDSLNEGLTITVYSSDGTEWFSSPVSSMALGTPDYRSFGIDHADKTNSGAHTWAVDDEVYIEVLPSQPDTSALVEPSTYGIGSFRYDDDLIDTSPGWFSSSFRLDNVRPSSATKLWIYFSPRQAYELTSVFDAAAGSKITLHAKTIANGNFQATLGTPIDKGNYYEFPISGVTDSGVDLVDGHLYGATLIPPSGAAAGAVNGFVDMDDVTVSINEGTRTLTLTGTFDIISNGTQYTKTDPSVVWNDTYGPKYFAFDSAGTLTLYGATTEASLTELCLVGYLWWHQFDDYAAGGFFNMMKHPEAPARTWYQELQTKGLQWYRGCLPAEITADGDGSLDAHVQVRCYSGHAILGGTNHDITARLKTDNIAKIGRNGSDSGGFYQQIDEGTSAIVMTTGSGRAAYITAGSSHSLTEAADGNFVWAHLIAATGDNYDEGKVLGYAGFNDYGTKKEAEDNLFWELSQIKVHPDNADAGMQSCIQPLYSFLVQTKTAYTNTSNSRIVTLTNGEDYVDVRSTFLPVRQWSDLSASIAGPKALSHAFNDRYVPTVSAVDPGVNDDVEAGYFVGAVWVNTVLGDCWICVDPALGAADWRQIAT